MTKRSENYCRDCAHTWFPRGQALSDKCPSCKGDDVTFLSLRDRPLPAPQIAPWPTPPPLAPKATKIRKPPGTAAVVAAILFVLAWVVAICFLLAWLTHPKKAPEAKAPAVNACPGRCPCVDGTCGCCGRGCCQGHGGNR